MNYNYHTHTYRCSHATGTEEEYIQRAIRNGIKYMGFSDHIPLKFASGKQSFYRVPVESAKEYISTIKALSEKYKDQIEIMVGFEVEYYPDFFDEELKFAREIGAEYLILGQHFDIAECHPDSIHSYYSGGNDDLLIRYIDAVIEGMKTGVFTYVAHPDINPPTNNTEHYKKEAKRLCTVAKELNIPLEINFLGIREGRTYPCPLFWEVCGEVASPVTFGFDAHDTHAAYDGESLKTAWEMVKKFNLNYIGKPDIILL